MNNVYSKKYIKYKSKYLDLKQHGCALEKTIDKVAAPELKKIL